MTDPIKDSSSTAPVEAKVGSGAIEELVHNTLPIVPGPEAKAEADREAPTIEALKKILLSGDVKTFNMLRPSGEINLTGIDLSGLDLSGINLSKCNLTGGSLIGTILRDADMYKAILDRTDLTRSDLDGAVLQSSFIRYAKLNQVVAARAADFRGAELIRTDMSDANFSGAIFVGATLYDITFAKANLSYADLTGARLDSSLFNNTNFSHANLHKAQLVQTIGEDVIFDGANLIGATAHRAIFTSSKVKVVEGKNERILGTSFKEAWVKDLEHDGFGNADDLLTNAIKDRLPPEGKFPVAPPASERKVLINGVPGSDKELFDKTMKQLDALVGMEEVKGFVHEFIESIKMNHARTQRGFHQEAASLNFIFTGSPGTGKTTTARIMSQLLASLGYLEKGHLVEVSRADLVGKFAGHTADQMRQKCTEALGGTLLIDEAYALAQDEQDGYGKEAIAELLKFIEDKRGKLCVVATGYKKEMQVFIDSNSGMDSRFQEIVDFKDYSNSELVEIGKTKMRESQFEYGPDYLAGLSLLCYLMKDLKEEKFGNGRVVRNAFETAIRRMAVRLDGNYDTPGALTLLKGEDLPFERWTGLKLTDEFLSKFTWQDTQNGKTTTFAYKEIPTNKEFPELTTESKRILELILKTIKLDKELERNPKMLELQEPAASVKPESSLSFDEINSVELVPPSAGPSVEQTH